MRPVIESDDRHDDPHGRAADRELVRVLAHAYGAGNRNGRYLHRRRPDVYRLELSRSATRASRLLSGRRRARVSTAAVVVLVFALLVGASPARADFSVAPTVIDIRCAPGEARLGTFTVQLHGERGRRFAIALEDVGQNAEGAFTFGAPSRTRFSASSWISLSPGTFLGAPDREQPIEFRVAVPRYAEPGDHVTSLIVKRLAPAGAGSAGIVEAVAVRLTVRVSGAVHEAVALRGPSGPALAGGGPINAAVTVRNTGHVRLDFDRANPGALAMRDGDHAPTRLAFTGVLYPGEARDFRLSWPDPPLFGHFRLQATVRMPSGVVSAHTGFWIVPWRQALALLLVACAAVVLVTGRRRTRSAT